MAGNGKMAIYLVTHRKGGNSADVIAAASRLKALATKHGADDLQLQPRRPRLRTKRKDRDKMTLDEYGEWAATRPKPEHTSREQRLAYLGLGLAGEAGEVLIH
jgi:hypothetical protein